jgi:hypothetical protein
MADIWVQFKVTTNKGLRQIVIELEKVTQDSGKSEWSMTFILGEKDKKSDPKFEELISVKVKIKPTNAAKANPTANKGLNDAQTAQALVAGDAAKLLSEGELSVKAVRVEAERVISVR